MRVREREREKKISYSVADKGKESSVAVTRDHRIERTGGITPDGIDRLKHEFRTRNSHPYIISYHHRP